MTRDVGCARPPLLHWRWLLDKGCSAECECFSNARTLAMIHGCVGPVFFTYCVLLATATSQHWRETAATRSASSLHKLAPAAIVAALVAYLQLVLGAQLRHVGAAVAPSTFRVLVLFHLLGAAVLVFSVIALAAGTRVAARGNPWLRRPATGLAALVMLQVVLGSGTWVVHYGWPAWFGDEPWAAHVLVNSEGAIAAHGPLQANITTATSPSDR